MGAIRAAAHEGWVVRVAVTELRSGQRFVFDEEHGGEGEVVTVSSQVCLFGIVEVCTEELDFPLDFVRGQMVTLAGEGE